MKRLALRLLLLFVILVPAISLAALTDNIVSYWKLDSNGNDSAGSNPFTATNITWDTSVKKLGTASALLGSASSLSAADSASLEAANLSIAFWLKTADTGANLSFMQRYTGATARTFRIYFTSGQLHGFFYDTANNNSSDFGNTTSLATDTWRFVVITSDGTNIKYYIDGSLAQTTGFAASIQQSHSVPFVIGTGNPVETGTWDGYVDDVGYWSRALTADEVTALYNSGAGLAYPFSSSQAPDLITFD